MIPDSAAILDYILDRYRCVQMDDDFSDDKLNALLSDLERVNRLDDPENKLRRLPEDRHGWELQRPWEHKAKRGA